MFAFLQQRARDRFARDVLAAIVRSGGPLDYTYEKETFALRRSGALLNLANTYALWQQAKGEQRDQIFANLVAASAAVDAPLPDFSTVESNLIAVVRERALFANAEAVNFGTTAQPIRPDGAAFEPCTAWFARAIVIDAPTHVSIISQEHLRKWGMTFDEVFALGQRRLQECSPPKFRPEQGYFVGTWNDDFDSSRVLVRSLFDDLPLQGEPVVCIPNRQTLMVAGSEPPDAILAMIAKAEEVVRTVPKAHNASPLLVTENGIEDFQVPPGSPLHQTISRVRRDTHEMYYAEQKAQLEERYEKEGKDIFVASAQVVRKPGEEGQLFTTWARGVPTLLPQADLVAVLDTAKPEKERLVGLISWDKLYAIAGDRMLETKLFPPRFYVSTFPSDEEIRQLQETR